MRLGKSFTLSLRDWKKLIGEIFFFSFIFWVLVEMFCGGGVSGQNNNSGGGVRGTIFPINKVCLASW